jgi:inorganic pyrophosphatase
VKVLGSMALIDEGETDHKIIVIRQDSEYFDRINNMDDVERYLPGESVLISPYHFKSFNNLNIRNDGTIKKLVKKI